MLVLAPGSRVGGRYVLSDRIGGGGMGEIWLATLEGAGTFRRKVVVKCVPPDLGHDQRLKAMLHDEARILGLLHHPNIVAPLDYFEDAEGQALVLEYVDGPSLRTALRAARRAKRIMPEVLAVWVGAEVARALDAAHKAVDETGQPLHLVHRDVSPDNVLLSRDGQVHLADFGVARAEGNTDETMPGVPKGKRGYMSPEQARGGEVGPTADVFALARVVAECADVLCSDGLRAVLDKAVAEKPADRFQTCAEFGDALLTAVPPPLDARAALAEWIATTAPPEGQTLGANASEPPAPRTPNRPSQPAIRPVGPEPVLFASVGKRRRSRTVRTIAGVGVALAVLWVVLPVAWVALHQHGLEPGESVRPGLHGPEGSMHIRTRPDGAEIYVDGQLRGVSPLVVALPEGKHQVRVGSVRLEKWRAVEVPIRAREISDVEVDLSR
ncbi:MAG: serine/threonine protein kinase [Deltaproteobacteria bacterium]|nr:serine/threonine protein kinase [Deltaproteobacteria bacterium]